LDYKIVERKAFEVVAKIEGLTAEEIAEKIFPGWSISGDGAEVFKHFLHVKREIDEETVFTFNTKYYSREDMPDGKLPDGYEVWQVPEYTWAVFKCVGGEQATQEMWKRIYSEWLPQAKYEVLQSVSSRIIYSKSDTSSPDCMSEIWLPVKKK